MTEHHQLFAKYAINTGKTASNHEAGSDFAKRGEVKATKGAADKYAKAHPDPCSPFKRHKTK